MTANSQKLVFNQVSKEHILSGMSRIFFRRGRQWCTTERSLINRFDPRIKIICMMVISFPLSNAFWRIQASLKFLDVPQYLESQNASRQFLYHYGKSGIVVFRRYWSSEVHSFYRDVYMNKQYTKHYSIFDWFPNKQFLKILSRHNSPITESIYNKLHRCPERISITRRFRKSKLGLIIVIT